MDLKKMLLALMIITFVASFLYMPAVKAEEVVINNYDNVTSEKVISEINDIVKKGVTEGEIIYIEDSAFSSSLTSSLKNYGPRMLLCRYWYSLTVSPKAAYVGQSVTANATTNNMYVTNVTFIWIKLFDGIKKTERVQASLKNGLKEAISTYELTSNSDVGSWLVFALFEFEYVNSYGCKCIKLFALRWTCFYVNPRIPQQIPDYPVVGTAGAMTSMIIGLGLFINKRKRKPF
ncbi:hypothetical protein KEJ24_02205 [Candidatus Bathyarchaeota archaeon]|nr:hypothetical protein [Candidatus Bathyarchaeota archaeon]